MLLSLARGFLRRISTLLSRFMIGAGGSGSEGINDATLGGLVDDTWAPELVDPLSLPNETLRSRESR